MIVVTHLLGTGHLRRAQELARAFRAQGHEATVVSGGMPIAPEDPGLVQLAPLRSDGVNFARLLDASGGEADAACMQDRRQCLLELLDRISPDVVVTELFPFGRRVLADEFLALLDAAGRRTPRPLVVASVRDILAPPSKPAKAARTESILIAHYDAVLVHSDPAATPLEASWPVTPALSPLLQYTGYVAPPAAPPHPEGLGTGEVLVSAGGGIVGDRLFAAAIAAARRVPDLTWRILVGGPPERAAALRAQAEGGAGAVLVEPLRPDFRQMLHHATCSVSMCGYNTTLDLLQAGTPALLVPFDDGGEVEQSLRAQALAALPATEVLKDADLTADALAAAVRRLAAGPRRPAGDLKLDGAAQSVRICEALLAQARSVA